MQRLFSFLKLTGCVAGTIVLLNSNALAQTTEPVDDTNTDPAATEPDVTELQEWKPGDGRPVWSKSPNPTTAPDSSWRPGDGRPPWGVTPGTSVTEEQMVNRPELARRKEFAIRPEWTSQPTTLPGQRSTEAKTLQANRGMVARGAVNPGRGRK
jgi:hypothetical protein